MRDFYRGAFKFVAVLAVLLAITAGILNAFFVDVVEVGHNAMAPTIIAGDTVLLWRTQNIELGDVALCPHPGEGGRFVLGRVVARAGQQLGISQEGHTRINGQSPDRDFREPVLFMDTTTGREESLTVVEESFLSHDYRYFFRPQRRQRNNRRERAYRVSDGHFLLSDNRPHLGEDSRAFGTVPPIQCVGVVFMRLFAAPSPSAIGNKPLDLIE